jgi:hypothetical protein
MNMNIVWTGWLFVAVPGSFAAFEAYALATRRTTLSRYVWNISKSFPPFGWIAGVLTGFLACHFWWGGIVCFAPQ